MVTFTSYITHNEAEITVEVQADVTPGAPAVWYMPNGDPGYPAEPAECEITSVTDEDGNEYVAVLSEYERDRLEETAFEKFENNRSQSYGW